MSLQHLIIISYIKKISTYSVTQAVISTIYRLTLSTPRSPQSHILSVSVLVREHILKSYFVK